MSVEKESLGRFDTAVVGGGVMGCSTALPLARSGQKVAVFDRRGLGLEASGRNAGSLSPMIKKAELVAHATEGYRMWMSSKEWLGVDIGAHAQPGLIVSYNEKEAESLDRLIVERCANGAQIEMITGKRAMEIEPHLSPGVTLAAYSEIDGHGESNRTGQVFNFALNEAGATIFSNCEVEEVVRESGGFEIRTKKGTAFASRIVLAGGAWLEAMASWLGFALPVQFKVNQMIVTERTRPVLRTVLGVQNGLLTLKQSSNGSIVIGGGWQGHGDLDKGAWHIEPDAVVRNLQLARYVMPKVSALRIVRTWLGLEAVLPDYLPAVGNVPGVDGAYVIGCCRGGWAIGPCLGATLADHILGRSSKLPIFDPGRRIDGKPFSAAGSGSKAM
ncbi:MAG: sarcosine oxidase subunit beta [Gammaproteobacteria bacterium]|jgi:sarcosine oxidase subunit beta